MAEEKLHPVHPGEMLQEQRHHVAFPKMAARLGTLHETPIWSDDEYRRYLQATLEGHTSSAWPAC